MSTREQLQDRWLTEEGKQIARDVKYVLRKQADINQLRQLTTTLPYIQEVAPALDLRGLQVENNYVEFVWTDFSGAHLEYTYNIGLIDGCQMRGTFLDGCHSINAIFAEDFTQASFVDATLYGTRFSDSNVSEANFTRARLAKAWLNRANFQGATFVNADMRFAFCSKSDFRGANLSGADLTDATLGGILFDQTTRLQGTNLTGARLLRDDFRAFALEAGAILGEGQGTYDLAELDTTVKILRQSNEDHHLDQAIEHLLEIRTHIFGHPMYPWVDELAPLVSDEILQEVIDAQARAMKTMGFYL